MQRMLWTQKLSDDKLRSIMDKVEDLQITGVTGDEELQSLAETSILHFINRVLVQ